jgi:mono/diheme cytochrome c family protein
MARPAGRAAIVIAIALACGAPAHAQEEARAQQVYAIFKAQCFECHAESRKARLDLRTDESLRVGGLGGPVITAHDPERSRLYQRITEANPARQMPPARPPLSEDDVALIRQWILDGGSLAAVDEAVPDEDKPAAALATIDERPITAADREYWAFRRPARVPVPAVPEQRWRGNPIDAFLRAAMRANKLAASPRADRRTLIRRAYLDVLGLPPSPDEVEAFVNDRSPDAWPQLIDRLLASPHYGERWARPWLDLVRYADSGGFEFDVDRHEMWRYRDYVVNAFNADKPYADFVREQLAGDEIAPESDAAMTATGFLRLGPESGGGERGRQDALDDLVMTTSLTFMGMTVACARCHFHKFDPIPQTDYYRIQAVFASTRNVSHPLVPSHEVEAHRAASTRIDDALKPLREKKKNLEAPFLKQLVDREVAALPEYLRIAWATPPAERTEGQRLSVAQIEKTLQDDTLRARITEKDIVALMPEDVRGQHEAVSGEIAELEQQRPKPYPTALAVGENGRETRPSQFLHRGSVDAKGPAMSPGVLSVAATSEYEFPEPPADAKSSHRRRGFAAWLMSPDNPLTARVMVNRIWQHHFGEGLVRTPSNFGRMGEPPSHPELLDWLALEFIDSGWSMKAIHRLILRSEAYQMASDDIPANVAIDPENRLLWRMPRQRLDAETLRDQMLAVAGTLDRTLGGPNVFPYIDPDLFEKSSRRDWPGKPDDDPSTWRRSLYVFSKRSIRYPLFEAFDQPNLVNSTDRRTRSTVAPQALILMNNGTVLFQARKFAERVAREAGADPAAQVRHAFRLALGRLPDVDEERTSLDFVRGADDALVDFCHALFNLNEFVYRP